MISSLIRAFNALFIAFTKRVSPLAGYNISSIAFGNGKFIGLAYNGSIHQTVVSTDGITWTVGTTLTVFSNTTKIDKIVFGNGIFVAYQSASDGSSAITVASSTDGITWTKRTTVFTSSSNPDIIYNLIFEKGIFMLIGHTGSNITPRIVTSTNGTSWTTRTTGLAAGDETSSVAYGNNMFVVTIKTRRETLTSTDGITWTKRTFPYQSDGNLSIVCFINNTFVIITTYYKAFTSSDGINWTQTNTTYPGYYPSIHSVNNLLYLNGYNHPLRIIYVSTNGLDWNILPTSFTVQRIDSIVYGNGLYVASSGQEIGTSTSGIG